MFSEAEDDQTAMYIGIGVGAGAVVLLIIIVLIIVAAKKCKKPNLNVYKSELFTGDKTKKSPLDGFSYNHPCPRRFCV